MFDDQNEVCTVRTQLVVPVFRRPGTALQIVANAVASGAFERIAVLLHEPSLIVWTDRFDPSVEVHIEAVCRPAGFGWISPHLREANLTVLVDDDTILSSVQMRRLVVGAESDRTSPVGVIGSRFPTWPYVDEAGNAANIYMERTCAQVHVLHQVYAVTWEHVLRYRATIVDLATFDPLSHDACADDIIMSAVGDTAPRIIDLGEIEEDPDSWSHHALHSAEGFNERRARTLEELDSIGLGPKSRKLAASARECGPI